MVDISLVLSLYYIDILYQRLLLLERLRQRALEVPSRLSETRQCIDTITAITSGRGFMPAMDLRYWSQGGDIPTRTINVLP